MCNPQLKALLRKNFVLMKRNPFTTACEIFFPIILMILLAITKNLFHVNDSTITMTDEEYLKNNTFFYLSPLSPFNQTTYQGLLINQGLY